jgi:hypothetical protein
MKPWLSAPRPSSGSRGVLKAGAIANFFQTGWQLGRQRMFVRIYASNGVLIREMTSTRCIAQAFDLAQRTETVLGIFFSKSSLIPWIGPMIIELLSREHRNIEKLLAVLERELEIFDRGGRPDYEVIRAIVSYFEVYPEVYHHPQEDLVFARLKARDPAAAAKVGDLAGEHNKGANRLRQVARAVDSILMDQEILRETVHAIIRDFIEHERHDDGRPLFLSRCS